MALPSSNQNIPSQPEYKPPEELDIGGASLSEQEEKGQPVPVRRVEHEPKRELPREVEQQPMVEERVEAPRPQPAPQVPPRPTPAVSKSETVQQIETIMSENLVDVYKNLSPEKQREFRVKGEETASVIEQLFITAKATAKKILDLIRSWLKIIPGVNKFFLEQEAKIKTDKIIALKKMKGK